VEDVTLKRTPAVTREYVEVLNRFQGKTRSSSTAVKNSNSQRQRLYLRSVYKVTRCRYIATALSVPLQGFLRRFGTLDWIHWNVHFGIAIAQSSWRAETRMSLANVFSARGYL
jgi:hypothetical protein